MTPDPPALRRYRPGSGYAVLGPAVVVLLPDVPRARAAAVWECVDGGGSFQDVLDVLVAGGLRSLPSVAMLAVGPAGSRLLLRGGVVATLATEGESSELAGPTDTTWAEHLLPSLEGWTLRAASAPSGEGEPLQVAEGLVRASLVSAGAPVPSAPGAASTGAHARDRVLPGARPEPGPEQSEPEVLEGAPATEAIAASDSGRVVARLVFSTGEEVEVDGPVVVGRNPDTGRATGAGEPRAVAVPSRSREISATHLEVRPGEGIDLGAAVVTDLASTNGTLLVQPGLPPEDLRPGVATALVPGAVIDLGDGVTISVSHP